MEKQIGMVKWFHKKCDLPNPGEVQEAITWEQINLRRRLMIEEVDEYVKAAYSGPPEEVARELADLLYIVLGTVVVHGLEKLMVAVFEEVHRSNSTKIRPDGTVEKRADGKVLKPDTYQPPNVKLIFEKR